MLSWLIGAPQRKAQQCHKRPAARPRLEALEDRLVPALLNHGGGVLASIQAQGIYLGSGWSASPIAPTQFDTLDRLPERPPQGTTASTDPIGGMIDDLEQPKTVGPTGSIRATAPANRNGGAPTANAPHGPAMGSSR